MQKRKIVRNKFLLDLQGSLEEVNLEEKEVQENIKHLEKFDFVSHEFTEQEKKFVQDREVNLVREFKKNSESLYNICVSMFEIQDYFKNDCNNKFVAWYTHAGLTKDRVSEYTKRAELYTKFPEKRDLISNISNDSIKALTKKTVSEEKQRRVLDLGYTTKKDILSIVEVQQNNNQLIHIQKYKYFDIKSVDKVIKDIRKAEPKSINAIRTEIEAFKKMIKEAEKELELKDKTFENKNNEKLFIGEGNAK